MRSGWATEKRIRPVRFDKVHPSDYEARKQACLSRIAKVEPVFLAANGIGRTFPATTIDVGSGAADYDVYRSGNTTYIDLTNPANDSGTLDTVEMWFRTTGSGVKIGTFSGSGTSWNDRDYETIGTVTSGSKQTFTGVDIDVVTDDILGCYFTTGLIELASSGGTGLGSINVDTFGAGATTYTFENNLRIAIYATGETVSAGARLLSLIGVGN